MSAKLQIADIAPFCGVQVLFEPQVALRAPAHGAGGGGRRIVEWVPPCGGYPPVAEAPNRLQSTRQAPAVPTLNWHYDSTRKRWFGDGRGP